MRSLVFLANQSAPKDLLLVELRLEINLRVFSFHCFEAIGAMVLVVFQFSPLILSFS